MIGRRLLHYEILEKLGQGGASVVYKARDTRLDRLVALKFLTHLRASPEAARALALREARAVSALSHANIAALFDVAETEDETFLVLEYLPGPALRAKINDAVTGGRPIPLAEAVGDALQMAQGLAHAHRRGIIHRDVKPGNAIFDAESVLKLTDFGLAKWIAGPQLTRPGTLLGTVSYMSPEQAEGRPADERSDVFSLGVVLYEMLTGQPPFQGDSDSAALYQIVHACPPSLAAFRSNLPAPLEALVSRALEKAPEDRYPHAGLLAEELLAVSAALGERRSSSSPSPSPAGERIWAETTVSRVHSAPTPAPTPVLSRPRRRRWLLAAAVAAAAVPLAVYWPFRGAAGVPSGSLLLLTGIENRTSHPEFEALTDLLRNQLGQSAHFSLVDDLALRELLERMVRPPAQKLDVQTAREVAWRGQIPLVVSGRLDQLGSSFLLSLQLESVAGQPTTPRAVWNQTLTAPGKDSLFEAIRQASTWIRRTAGEASRDLSERDQPVAHTTTNSWEALRLFSQAEERIAQDRDEDAILLLKEAVKVDPDFAMAHGRLGDIYVKLRRDTEGFEHWRAAIATSGKRTLTKREELRIKALYAMDTGDWKAAEALFRTFALYFPNDYYPHFYHGMALRHLGQTAEAIEKLRHAERLQPSLYHMPAHLAMAHFSLAQFGPAAEHIARVRALRRPHWATFLEGLAHFLQGNPEAARQSFRSLAQCPEPYWRSRGQALQACLAAEMGRYAEAERALSEGIAADAKGGQTFAEADKLLALAWIRLLRGKPAACRAACLRAVQLDSSPNRVRRAGTVLSRAGFPEEAQKLLAGSSLHTDLPVFTLVRHQVSGEIHLARGDSSKALEEFRKADALELPERHREYLARALEASGDRAGALRVYQQVAAASAPIWRAPEEDLPGLWAEALFRCARLARLLGHNLEFQKTIEQYLALTSQADPGPGHVAEARAMVAEAGRKPATH